MKWYQMNTEKDKKTAELYLFGDITSCSDECANLVKELQTITAKQITVYINSYGGEVAIGLAIYNALKRHKAKITTVCDGMACSIASVIFMAGDKRIMNESSLLMIHNAWTDISGNAAELRKQADDLEKISEASKRAYLEKVSLSEEDLQRLLDNETWISASEALEWGFATEISGGKKTAAAAQCVKRKLCELVLAAFDDEEDLEGVEESEGSEETDELTEGQDESKEETDELTEGQDESEEPKEPEEPGDWEEPEEPTEESGESEEETKDDDTTLQSFFNALMG